MYLRRNLYKSLQYQITKFTYTLRGKSQQFVRISMFLLTIVVLSSEYISKPILILIYIM